ncbi:MAG TPA: HAD-IC family P-type ATPase, partial [Streptosporangiaceae bacterium]|nr:HAD-IC family P-type ATPase [Streptosporangiaceae bacterium]
MVEIVKGAQDHRDHRAFQQAGSRFQRQAGLEDPVNNSHRKVRSEADVGDSSWAHLHQLIAGIACGWQCRAGPAIPDHTHAHDQVLGRGRVPPPPAPPATIGAGDPAIGAPGFTRGNSQPQPCPERRAEDPAMASLQTDLPVPSRTASTLYQTDPSEDLRPCLPLQRCENIGVMAVVRGEVLASSSPVPTLSPQDVFVELKTSPRGLTADDAAARQAEFGANQLPQARSRSVLAELGSQFANMFAVVLMVAAGITVLTYLLSTPRESATLVLAIGILCVVLLNAIIGFVQEHAAERTAEALQAMVPATVRVIRDGELSEVPAVDLVPGDLVRLDAGDAIPADCRLVETHDLLIEMAALTGESRPVPRIAEAVRAERLADARNCVFMGTSVINGTARAVVVATGLGTEFGRIYRLTSEQKQQDSPLQREVNSMARRVAAVAIAAGAGLFAIRALASHDVVGSFVFALGVMVALVPEGLPATMSVSLAVAVRRMARRHALIKRLTAVEALGSTTVICTDKTGTLTKAEMTVQSLWESGRQHEVTGVGYAPTGDVSDPGSAAALLRAAGLCCDARLLPPDSQHKAWRVLGDTTEGAILVAAAKAGIDLKAEEARTPRTATLPFDASRKMMTTIHRVAGGSRADGRCEAFVKGSPQAVLERCIAVRWDGADRPLDPATRDQIGAAIDALAGQGLRVLAVARRDVAFDHPPQAEAEAALTLLGMLAMSDPPRPEVVGAVWACRGAGIAIYMITGDYGLTAEAIARRIGI